MKLYNFVNETTQEEVISQEMDEIVELIKKDCKPFLKEFDMYKNPIYRGSNKDMAGEAHFMKVRSRKKRRPKDLPQHLHNTLDEMFFKKFGWKSRSEGIFVTHDRRFTGQYGWQVLFFPKGKYQYVWSPKIEDIYASIRNEITENLPHMNPDTFTRDIRKDEVNDEFIILLEELVDTYKTKNYNQETERNEAMFKCFEYYMVAFDTQREDRQFLTRLKDAL